MLYCSTCQMVVQRGSSQCQNCKTGFVSQLVCGDCGRLIARGLNVCSECDAPHRPSFFPLGPSPLGPSSLGPSSPPPGPSPFSPGVSISISVPRAPAPVPGPLANLPARMLMNDPVPDGYSLRRFGVEAEVQLSGNDADILTKMRQSAALLYVLADEMNKFQGHLDSTRKLMKACRNLAADIQEEVDLRLGPRGGRE